MSQLDSGIKTLQEDIFRSKVARARALPASEKLLLGLRLFDEALPWMRAGIRSAFPDFTEEQVDIELRRRLAVGKRLSDGSRFERVESEDG